MEQYEVKEKDKPVAHIYAFAITWVLYTVVEEFQITPTFGYFIAVALIAFSVSGIVRLICFLINR